MKFDMTYLDLISPDPVNYNGIKIRCPQLKQIREKNDRLLYNYFISLFTLTPYDYYKSCNLLHLYEEMSDEAKVYLTMYDLIVQAEPLQHSYGEAFNFFMEGQVLFNIHKNCYEVHSPQEDGSLAISGIITKDNFSAVVNIILERNFIKTNEIETSSIKNEKALKIAMKMQKGREQKKTAKSSNNDLEIANIISALVAYKESVNYLNIWDYTVYQLWDSFYRQCHKMVYDKENTSTAIWGDKSKQFHINHWYKKMQLDN